MKDNKNVIARTSQRKSIFRTVQQLLLCLLVLLTLPFAVGTAFFVRTAPAHPSVAGILIDQSASVGGPNFVNQTLPYAAQIVAKIPSGTFLQVQSVGGAQDGGILFSSALTSANSVALRSKIAALKISTTAFRGSNISLAALNMAKSLSKVQGNRKIMFFLTDGLDDNPSRDAVARQIKSLNAKKFVVCLLFTRGKNPLVAQAMSAAGAKVIIAQDQQSANAAIDATIYGEPTLRRLRGIAFTLFCLAYLLAMATIIWFWLRERAATRRLKAEQLAREALAMQKAEQLRKDEEITFAPETCDLSIRLNQTQIFRSLIAGNGSIAIAGESCDKKVDMSIPNRLLSDKRVAASLKLVGDMNLSVKNHSHSKILVGDKWLEPQQSMLLSVPGSIQFGPQAIVEIKSADAESSDLAFSQTPLEDNLF